MTPNNNFYYPPPYRDSIYKLPDDTWVDLEHLLFVGAVFPKMVSDLYYFHYSSYAVPLVMALKTKEVSVVLYRFKEEKTFKPLPTDPETIIAEKLRDIIIGDWSKYKAGQLVGLNRDWQEITAELEKEYEYQNRK